MPPDGLVDTHLEEQAVELFATNVMEAGRQYLERPMDAPFIPPGPEW